MKNYSENFELWCRECVTISDKLTGAPVPFVLNRPQRRLLEELERQRLLGKPIRIILLKARQWGGSTLIQTYMAWMQLMRRSGWNSLICAHVKDAAAGIKGMYSMILKNYPSWLKEDNPDGWKFVPYEKSQSVSYVPARDCKVAIGSAQAPDALRGGNYHMAHLSEAAFWSSDGRRTASQVVRTVCGTIPALPDTLVVVESTANGRGDYFHREWVRAVEGKSDKTPVFVPWHEIEIYSRELKEGEWERLLPRLSRYERGLLSDGVARENVAWYHYKRREYGSDREMMAEFPTTPEEAFATSGTPAFAPGERPIKELRGERGEPKDKVMVFAPGDDKSGHCLLTAGRDDSGRIHILSDEHSDEPLPGAMSEVISRCRREALRLAVADIPFENGSRHGRWCLRRARNAGVGIVADGDESPEEFGYERLGELADHYRWLLTGGSVVDDAPEELYADFSLSRPYEHRQMLCRLLAGIILHPYSPEAPASPDEFFPEIIY